MSIQLVNCRGKNNASVCCQDETEQKTVMKQVTFHGVSTLTQIHLDIWQASGSYHSELRCFRAVIILVRAGAAVDAVIESLSQHMEEGDIVIDGGNEW